MTDGIIKGTGDSRYLKTVTDAMTRYPTYESFIQALASGTLPIDLNGINTAGWEQQGTPLIKANLLSDTTAASLGLTGDPTVDDALGALSRFNLRLGEEYLWAKRIKGWEPLWGTSSSVYLIRLGNSSATGSVTLYRSLIIDENGNASLADEYKTYTGTAAQLKTALSQSELSSVQLYGYNNSDPSVIFKTIPGTSAGNHNTTTYDVYMTATLLRSVIDASETVGYVNSPEENAFPPEADDGFVYASLGQLGERLRIATGSYVGTGTYGANNPITLEFSFKPMFVMVYDATNMDYVTGFSNDHDGSCSTIIAPLGAAQGRRMSDYGYSFSHVVVMTDHFTWGGSSFSWYTTFSINTTVDSSQIDGTSQLNCTGKTYRYVAIGV